MDQLIRWGREALPLAFAAGLAALALWGVLVWARTSRIGRRAATRTATLDGGLVLSLAAIAVVGLRPGFGPTEGWVQWNFVPFLDAARSLDQPSWVRQIAITNLAGNIAFFVPWGFMFALRFRRAGWVTLLAGSAAVSVAVEIAQAIMATGRLSDITDVLMNTTGGALGFLVGRWAVVRLPRLGVAVEDGRMSMG